jgi:hypothetical protein
MCRPRRSLDRHGDAVSDGVRRGRVVGCAGGRVGDRRPGHDHEGNEDPMADKSPRQHQSKKSGKTLKQKRAEKSAKQATKRSVS